MTQNEADVRRDERERLAKLLEEKAEAGGEDWPLIARDWLREVDTAIPTPGKA